MSKYTIGAKFKNRQGSTFTLVRHEGGPFWTVRFESGYETVAKTQNIVYGKVKDYLRPSVYGVGYIGSGMRIPTRESGDVVRKHYDLWANMLKRTTQERGYEDVTVHPAWHNFTTFNSEITTLEGYSDWLLDSAGYHLDKDLSGSRTYSKSTCRFIPASDNLSDASNRRWGNK